MYRRILLSMMAILSLGISVNIYTDLRGYDHGLFKWADAIFPLDLSLVGGPFSDNAFVLYNLPDGLWMLSLCLVLILVWDTIDKSFVLPWLLASLLLAYGLEVLQFYGLVTGTFDGMDIMIYTGVFLITSIFYLLQKSPKWKTGKHTYFHY